MNTASPNQLPISATKAWLKSVVIQLNLCPFAKREFESDTIAYKIVDDEHIQNCLLSLIEQCHRLDVEDNIQTVLLIYTTAFADFEDYLEFLEYAESLLLDQGYGGIYQLASFHPDYCFEGVALNDASNYTNRSPYPMLHLLRESSIEQALIAYSHPEKIPQRNIELTRKMGADKLQTLLEQCFSLN